MINTIENIVIEGSLTLYKSIISFVKWSIIAD